VVKILDRLCASLAVISGALFLFITFSICYSILTRSIGVPTPIWVVQFNEYALLWITFLGTAWVLAKDKHISIHIITSKLSERGKRKARAIQDAAGSLMCIGFCYYCSISTWEHFERHIIDVKGVDVPKAFVLCVIPLGFFLLSLQFLRRLAEDFGWIRTEVVHEKSPQAEQRGN
jgi:TRAP-type C4-dicarboxylate transport system permease small subunit